MFRFLNLKGEVLLFPSENEPSHNRIMGKIDPGVREVAVTVGFDHVPLVGKSEAEFRREHKVKSPVEINRANPAGLATPGCAESVGLSILRITHRQKSTHHAATEIGP